MGSEKVVPKRFRLSMLLAGGVALAGMVAGGVAWAGGNERAGGWLRSYAGSPDHHAREPASLAPEAPRRQDADDARNQRRWSSEERRQLRRDVHEAGRDVYGNPPRRPDSN